MILHQVVIRKDGPIHAIEYIDGEYSKVTLCGLALSGLERPKRRRFAVLVGRCGRCVISYQTLV